VTEQEPDAGSGKDAPPGCQPSLPRDRRPLVPALLHLRVPLELQQLQLFGHEGLHSRRSHRGCRPRPAVTPGRCPRRTRVSGRARASTHEVRAASASASGRGCRKHGDGPGGFGLGGLLGAASVCVQPQYPGSFGVRSR
jgi:hypothetical protein